MNNLGSRQIELSLFESEKTWVTIHTAQWHKYTTDVFREDVFSVLVWQKTGDSIEKLVMHRWTTRNQILIGNLEQKIKAQLVELL